MPSLSERPAILDRCERCGFVETPEEACACLDETGERVVARYVSAERALGHRAVTAALAVAQERGHDVSRERVADMLAAAWRVAVGV
jgi:hypothetical protein